MANEVEKLPGQETNARVSTPILTFRDKIGDLARPNLFQVDLGWPDVVTSDGKPDPGADPGSTTQDNESKSGASTLGTNASSSSFASFLIKAANIPAATVGVIEVPYRGRTLKIAGDRTFEPWTITVLNDQNFALRNKFEEWSTKIQALHQNKQSTNQIEKYQTNAWVRQLGRQGQVIKTYKFEGIWPSTISAIDLAWDSNDTPEEYTVEFQVQYWTYDSDRNTGNSTSLN